MDISERTHRDLWILKITGSLDAVTSTPLEKRILEQLDLGIKAIAFDLSSLAYVSSAGIRVFLLAAKKMKSNNAWLRFCGLSPEVKQIFDLTGLSFRIDILPSIDAALQQFDQQLP